ncbi:MAG: PhoH family protein [Bacteroidales bacterium]|nr:PhoH family protein [Bacteroidales bacterium]
MDTKNQKTKGQPKIFVFDTSVILHDHNAVFSFDDNDIVIPITVLEELDNFKKGNDTKNFECREFIRIMDRLSQKSSLQKWTPIGEQVTGRIKVILNESSKKDATKIFGSNKNDHWILNAALRIIDENPERKVILVSKDINLRIKAKALGIQAEDFETGKIKDIQQLYTGQSVIENVSEEVLQQLYADGNCEWDTFLKEEPIPNHYFVLKSASGGTVLAYYNSMSRKIERVDKNSVSRIVPRNAEQTFALHALMNPDVQLVTLQGIAGTGKTLLALAAALAQQKMYKQIFLARPIIPLGNQEIGFLPGTADDKIGPYMEPLYDNLKFIQSQYGDSDKEAKMFKTLIETEKIIISPLAYIRGRSLSNIFFIVDESQNLTPLEIKTIITRAGEGTKIVFTGDIHQIDTPYLDAQSNGFSTLIEKIQRHPIYAHIRLEKGERSQLANLATLLL